jgi:hypothetical protein
LGSLWESGQIVANTFILSAFGAVADDADKVHYLSKHPLVSAVGSLTIILVPGKLQMEISSFFIEEADYEQEQTFDEVVDLLMVIPVKSWMSTDAHLRKCANRLFT